VAPKLKRKPVVPGGDLADAFRHMADKLATNIASGMVVQASRRTRIPMQQLALFNAAPELRD
jgi:hypothetical protein